MVWDRPRASKAPHRKCRCLACEDWWAQLIAPGMFALPRPVNDWRSIPADHPDRAYGRDTGDESAATPWDALAGRFVWLEKIPLGTQVVVLSRLSREQPGGHLDAVFVTWFDAGGALVVRATSRKWLMPADTAEEIW